MPRESHKYQNKNFHESKKVIKIFFIFSTLAITGFFVLDYIDRPVFIGHITGKIISVSTISNSHRSFIGIEHANIKLDNGDVIYKKLSGAKEGQHVTVFLYKRRITKIKLYR
ncbi:hypothetical protein [Agarilytica rhodophyticola]|uniref:hypothetical protein n=1 Tax=Agarilytica rhodophyticola TaxID=1737490 RepID=UPI000B3479BB|nr:hypothetical protein [Agarilytica rhodophyticola]